MAMLIETNGSRKSIYKPEDNFSIEDIEFYTGVAPTMMYYEDTLMCFNQSSSLDINRDATDSIKFAYPELNLTIRGRVFLCNINQLK